MLLRTRIALTFLLLLAAVLAAELVAVSMANHVNERRAVNQQLEFNRRLLTQAANAVAEDFGFKEAVTDHDTDTLVSVLENAGRRVNASRVILMAISGEVIAATGSSTPVGTAFPIDALRRVGSSGEGVANILVDGGRIYQVVAVPVNAPITVAWIAMGFELDDAADGLPKISGQRVSLIVHTGTTWNETVTSDPARELRGMKEYEHAMPIPASMDTPAETKAKLTLARSFANARAPFETLTKTLFIIAVVSLLVFAWAAFGIARNITRPLQNLTLSVDKIRGGSYDVPLGLARHDELGVLAEGLQLMQKAVMSRDRSIRKLAYEDTLTGLMNRTAFSASLSQVLKDADGAPLGIAIINLHRFRRINEHLGYSVGDAVLTTTAARLAAVPSVFSAVARLAADEFAAFARLKDRSELQAWGASLLVALSEPVSVEAQPIDISATIGLAFAPNDAPLADGLLRCADLALERARRDKRPMGTYEEEGNSEARDQLSLLGELRRALEQDELKLFFQPKIELATGRVAGAEALLRWQHPTRGLLAPGAFIPFAEKTGFIRRITRWTLDRAMAQSAEWHRAGTPVPLAVNVSADDLSDTRLDARVAGLLTRHQLPPSLITLEITESGFIDDPTAAMAMLDALDAIGVHVSIDDFGTGYSSLSHLARMPAHEVKIDRSFVQELESNAEFTAIVRSAIEMGHSLGMKVVAEGIETEAVAHRLKSLGCDVGQGYLYSKPMPLAQWQAWLYGRPMVPVVAEPIDFHVSEVTDTLTLATF